ncbi:mRNA-capping enzyme subunit beta, partial [Lunasporangiospora selenospora]
MSGNEPTKRPRSEDEEVDTSREQLAHDTPPSKKSRPTEASSSTPSASSSAPQPQATPTLLPPQQRQVSLPIPRKDLGFFGAEVLDDVVRTIGEFLFEHCHYENVEIEAKLGILTDLSTRSRIELPVRNEVVLTPQNRPAWYRFSSDMTLAQHAHFNRVLNERFKRLSVKEAKEHISYAHTKEVDQFYQGGPDGKVRVTRDQSTNKVIENGTVKKERIADLDVYSPRNPFDFRVSVNVEVPKPLPTGTVSHERHKDRVSYRHHNFKIDLTQVKTMNSAKSGPSQQQHNYSRMRPVGGDPSQELTHELEIEFVDAGALVHERKVRLSGGNSNGAPDRFMDVVGSFVNNIRGLLVRGQIPQQQFHGQGHHPAQHPPNPQMGQ